MKIYYMLSEYQVNNEQLENAVEQMKEKECVQKSDNWRRAKFCLFQVQEENVLLVFSLDATHVDVAMEYLELKKIPKEAFRGAGKIEPGKIVFDSDSCHMEFGYDTPSEKGVEEKIEEALCQDDFFK